MRQSNREMFRPIEIAALIYTVALVLIPPYLQSIAIAGFKIKTLLNIMLVLAIFYRSFAITTNNFRISSFSFLIYILMLIGWTGIILSALTPSSSADFSMRSLLESEVLPDWLAFTVFVICGSQPGFLQRYCQALMMTGLIVVAFEFVEVLSQKNPFSHLAADTVVSISDTSRNGAYRAFSTLAHPLILAEFLSFTIAAALFNFMDARLSGKIIASTAILLFCVGEYFTNTRSSLILIAITFGLFAAGVWLSAAVRRAGALRIGFFTILFLPVWTLMIGFVIPAIMDFVVTYFSGKTGDEIASTLSRNKMHTLGIQYIFEHPFGYGYGGSIYLVAQDSLGNLSLDDYFLFVALNSGVFSALALLLVALCTSTFALSRAISALAPRNAGAFLVAVPILWTVCSFTQTIWDIHYIFYSVVAITVSYADRALTLGLADLRITAEEGATMASSAKRPLARAAVRRIDLGQESATGPHSRDEFL